MELGSRELEENDCIKDLFLPRKYENIKFKLLHYHLLGRPLKLSMTHYLSVTGRHLGRHWSFFMQNCDVPRSLH